MRPLTELTPRRLTVLSGGTGSGKTRTCCDWSEQVLSHREPVLWLDGDQGFSPRKLARSSCFSEFFWGYVPSTSRQAYNLALAFLRLRVAGLIVLDSIDGLLPDRCEQQIWIKRFMPRLIGALHRSESRFLCTSHQLPNDHKSALRTYAHQHINLEDSYVVY